MIVTLTPNTGLDRAIFLERFEWGQTIRAAGSTLAMGGKGTDVSMVLGTLGYPNLALGFAAGETGQRMQQMLEDQGAGCDFAWAVMLPHHGIVVAGRDLDDAYDTLERLSVSARVHIYRGILEST
ncbi:MAG: class II aldolase/adducin family protein [Chloroflexota bacterium]|nr:class II aldolase/adducin family protein [Chloroflexota bacterium]